MAPKSSTDSGKKGKKSERDGNSGPNKKHKRSSSVEGNAAGGKNEGRRQSQQQSQHQQQEAHPQQALSMTIPRKRDKGEVSAPIPKKVSSSATTTSSSSNKQGKNSSENNDASKSETSVAADKEIQGTIPKKSKTSEKSSKGSNDGTVKTSYSSSVGVDDKSPSSGAKVTEKGPKTVEKTSKVAIKIPEKSFDSVNVEVEDSTSAGDATINQSNESNNNSKCPEPKDKEASTSTSTKSDSDKVPISSSSPAVTTTGAAARRTSIKSSGGTTTPKPLRIDTSMTQKGNTTGPLSASTPSSTKQPKTPTSTAMDNHPYARGSVIEVHHGISDAVAGDDWWFEDSDDEDDDSDKGNKTEANDNKVSSVRLCDVIDRVSIGDKQWRYYVHYRDFNRRMDEWVAMERIVSPPSVGNAKARAIKKEEERQKRKLQRIEERNAAELSAAVDVSAPRSSRRRSSIQTTGTGNDGGVASTPTEGGTDSETPRRTRLQRKKSFVDTDDATVVAGNSGTGGAGRETAVPPPPSTVVAADVGVVNVPTNNASSHTVGEHVVVHLPAQELDEHEGLDEASLREHEEVTKVKNVAFVELGPHQMETWYFSPLPKELLSEKGYIEVLYVCEFTFSLFSRKSELQRFQARLPTHLRHPPGNEIYRNGNLAMFEVDGFQERIYCQNLCYIAKLFLDHKTLYFDVDPFLFYVMCEVDNRGFHPVGYYSKEKYSDVGYNLACILTFPSHQRKGYGRFLIAFSYELSKKEEKVGSPEKPMSDLGQQAYKPYWASTIVDFLLNQSADASSMSIMDISKLTSIMAEDIVFTLNQLGILKIINGVYFVAAEESLLKTLAKKYPVKNPKVDPTKLHWTPFVTDVKRDKFSIHSKKPSVDGEEMRGSGGFP